VERVSPERPAPIVEVVRVGVGALPPPPERGVGLAVDCILEEETPKLPPPYCELTFVDLTVLVPMLGLPEGMGVHPSYYF
jgi:hypothetical protein